MEVCPAVPLRNISILTDNQAENPDTENEEQKNLSPSKTEIEIIKEQVKEKVENKPITAILGNKNTKIKTVKLKKIERGKKRKLPDKSESNKKVKRKKKEEKIERNENREVKEENLEDGEIEIVSVAHSTPLPKRKDCIVENDSDVENRDSQVKQKSKQMSARKSKAVTNACKETLDVLLKLEPEMLGSMDKSLKILKSHNLLNNKLIPMDTLMDLISLALETTQAPEAVDSEKEVNLSRIVSKLTDVYNTPKAPRGRHSIIALSDSPKKKSVPEEGESVSPCASKEEIPDKENLAVEEVEKMEECDTSLEIQEISQVVEPALEKSGKNFCITNYFKKLKKTVEERDKNERFSSFTTKTDMYIAPKLGGELTPERREKFETEFNNQTCEVKNFFQLNPKYSGSEANKSKKSLADKCNNSEIKTSQELTKKSSEEESIVESDQLPDVKVDVEGKDDSKKTDPNQPVRKKIVPLRIERPQILPTPVVSKTKAKLIQFHENRRPPYWGTWRRKSENVKPRRPFGKDKLLNYEIDSDDEWESEEEPGESLHGSDDEKEPEEDYEVDNDFFVPHGYLSDDENPEKEDMSPKTKLDMLEEQFTSEQKQKTRKMTPFVFGCFWVHKGETSEGSLYQDLQVESLQYTFWTTAPIQIEEDDKKNESISDQAETSSVTKKPRQKTFPDEEIPNLIKMIHGSPQNCDHLAKKFLLYWEGEKVQDGKRPGLTKVCVLKKIKELATWQASQEKGRCWLVPKEVRKEFGADTGVESPAKKSKKCFIWKFVKRPGKESELGASSKMEPEVVVLET